MAISQVGSEWSRQTKPRHISFDTPEFYVAKLEEALGTTRGQPVAFPELLGRLRRIWADDDRQYVLNRLEQMSLPSEVVGQTSQVMQQSLEQKRRGLPREQQEQLALTLTELVSRAGELAPRERDRADRAVARLSRLLPVEQAWRVVEPWFGDRRAFRRSVVVRVLLEHGVPPALATGVIAQYRSSKDRGLLKLIGRNSHVASLFEEGDVLEALAAPEHDWQVGPFQTPDGPVGPILHRDRDARYWKMRAIEVLLIGGQMPSDVIAFERPMELVWAVGRQYHAPSLPLLRRVLERYQCNPEFVWRCMRAFDRVGEPSDVEQIRKLATAIDASSAESRAA
jgi:hypothetical protein